LEEEIELQQHVSKNSGGIVFQELFEEELVCSVIP